MSNSASRPLTFRNFPLEVSRGSSEQFPFFMPVPLGRAVLPEGAAENQFTDILLSDQENSYRRKVAVLTSVLDVALRFNRATVGGYAQPGIRACDVFALASLTGDLHLDTSFWREGGYKTRSHTPLQPIAEVDLAHYAEPGQVVRLYAFEPDGKLKNHHYQVCASKQDDPSQLYMSRLGDTTIVGAHTMQTTLDVYGSTHIGVVESIQVLPFSAPEWEPSLGPSE